MNFKRVVGLTGGMGAGKSTLVQMIREEGIWVHDVDQRVAALYEDPVTALKISRKMGLDEVYTKSQMARLVVEEPSELTILEGIVGPMLTADLLQQTRADHQPFMVVDAPLLFEMFWQEHVDFTILVHCPEEIRRPRIMTRPGMTEAKMNLLLRRQYEDQYRLDESQFIIDNSGDIGAARSQLATILVKLREFYS